VTRRPSLTADPPHVVRALVATADRRLAASARKRLAAAGVTVCDEAADAEGAVRLAREFRPDLCLLDVTLPGDAMTALHGIRDRAPATRVVMLANAADDPALPAALHAGAGGCIIGTPDGPALERTLGDLLAGHVVLPRALLTRLVADLGPA
jgi:DNA-binding NarL/FixJ family response regulator